MSLISNRCYQRFLRLEGNGQRLLDEDRLAEAASWDGLHGVTTNVEDLSPAEVASHYHALWQIEQCFRIAKSDLHLRPIYLWTEKRVRAHIAMCFMALVCVRHLTHRFAIQYERLSAAAIRRQLLSIQVSVLKHETDGSLYGLPSNITVQARQLYQSVGLKLSNVPYRIR